MPKTEKTPVLPCDIITKLVSSAHQVRPAAQPIDTPQTHMVY